VTTVPPVTKPLVGWASSNVLGGRHGKEESGMKYFESSKIMIL
jgi:hypothetical protein